MPRVRLRNAAWWSLLPLAACSFGELSDLQSGGGAGSSAAGAANDAGGGQGGAPAAAGAQGAPAGGAGGQGGAGGAAFDEFRDDFEGPVGAQWALKSDLGAEPGLVREALLPGNASPQGLRVVAPAGAGGRVVSLGQVFEKVTSLKCEVDLYVETYPADVSELIYLLSFQYVMPDPDLYFTVSLALQGPNGAPALVLFQQGAGQTGTTNASPLADAFPRKAWVRVALDASTVGARLSYAGEASTVEVPVDTAPSLGARVNLGITWADPSGPLEFRYDNLACTYR